MQLPNVPYISDGGAAMKAIVGIARAQQTSSAAKTCEHTSFQDSMTYNHSL